MQTYIEKIMRFEDLTSAEMIEAANLCFTGAATDVQTSAFLTALRMKGETSDEIAGLVEVIISVQPLLKPKNLHNVMDNCGTGGDRSNSFNISTTAAFVIAGAGVPVAKHGNRSISSKTGSADVLSYLGVSLTMSRERVEEVIEQNNIAFLFAPFVHTNMQHFMTVRKELSLPTILNIIGPLTNPVQLESQYVGVYRRDMVEVLAHSLHKLGRKRALVVNGAGFMDEASLAGENHFALLENDKVTTFTLSPEDVDLPQYDNTEILGGTSEENAEILLNVLKGKAGAHLDTVLLNAGLGLFANGKAETIQAGIELARESIRSGAALRSLERLIEFSKEDVQTT